MTSTIHRRLLMLKKACRRGDFEGWARESRHWFEMDGMVRRLYMGDGLAVNAHEDGFFGHGIDSISVSGTGVNIVLDIPDTDIGFFYWGFEAVDCNKGFRVRFAPDNVFGGPSPPSDITDADVWDRREVERLLSVVCHRGGEALSDNPVIRLGDGLTITVDRATMGSLKSPQADVTYRQGAVSVEFHGTLARCREGVAVLDGCLSFVVIALPRGSAEGIGGAVTPCLQATLRYLNSNLDACCEGPWFEDRIVPKDFDTKDEKLSFPFPEGLYEYPDWRDMETCLGIKGRYDCDLFYAGTVFEEVYFGPMPDSTPVRFVFKPSGFRIYEWSCQSRKPIMNQPLTEGELRHMMRLCRAYIREHPQGCGNSAEDD